MANGGPLSADLDTTEGPGCECLQNSGGVSGQQAENKPSSQPSLASPMGSYFYAFPPRMMRASQAAYMLGIGKTTFLTLGLPKHKIGGCVVYDLHDIMAYADRLTGRADPVDDDDGRDHGEISCDDLFGET